MAKPDWDIYFMRIAYLAATRATCDRKHVGALIVDPYRRIVSTGYNGAPSGMPSCDEVGHELSDNHCVRSLHAESNAIDYAGRMSMGCTIYVTVTPCYDCAKRIVGAGIAHVMWDEFYQSRYGRSGTVAEYLASAGVKTTQMEPGRMALFREFVAGGSVKVLEWLNDANHLEDVRGRMLNEGESLIQAAAWLMAV